MSRVTELEKALTTLFRKGAEVGYTETEIDEFLENIDYHALLQAVWNKAETVYAYATNQKVAEISGQVGLSPQAWNGSIFSMIQNLSETVIVPIAGAILAFVMTLELIQLITDKNNLNDMDTWIFFKWAFKSAAAVLIVTNTWTIVMGVFDAAQSVVASASGLIIGDTSINISSVMVGIEDRLMEMELGPLFGLWFQSLFVGITMWALTICMMNVDSLREYCEYYHPIILRYDKKAKVGFQHDCDVFNYGGSKGATYERVVIIPVSTTLPFIERQVKITSNQTRAKFYVACTRAKHSVVFAMENPCENGVFKATDIHFSDKSIPAYKFSKPDSDI